MNIDFDAYKAYRSARGRPAPLPPSTQPHAALPGGDSTGGILPGATAGANEPPAPYPTSFAHIVELVTTGQPIPGIKDIPSTVLTGQGSQATQTKRRKPWEKDAPAAAEGAIEGATA